MGVELTDYLTKMVYSAKKQMESWGWADGQGIGKNNQGRKTFVKTKLKMDKSGLGSNTNEIAKNDDPWWAKAFNKTAKKIRRKAGDSDVSSDSDSEEDGNVGEMEEVDAKYDSCGVKLNSKKHISMRIKNARRHYKKSFISAGILNPADDILEQIQKDKEA